MEQKLIMKRIENLEKELDYLKKLVNNKAKSASIKGMLKGMKVTDEDIKEAKRCLFHNGSDHGHT